MDVRFDADTKIADSEREFKMNQAAYQKEVNTAVRWENLLCHKINCRKLFALKLFSSYDRFAPDC